MPRKTASEMVTYADSAGSPKLHTQAGGVRVDKTIVARLVALIPKMMADPYVMGRPNVASVARSCLLVGLEHLELRYGVKVESPLTPPVVAEAAE